MNIEQATRVIMVKRGFTWDAKLELWQSEDRTVFPVRVIDVCLELPDLFTIAKQYRMYRIEITPEYSAVRFMNEQAVKGSSCVWTRDTHGVDTHAFLIAFAEAIANMEKTDD
jgi:hypothetical protein